MPIFPPAMQKALIVFGSSITSICQCQLAESGRKRTAWAISRSVISWTFLTRAVPVFDFAVALELPHHRAVGRSRAADRVFLGHENELAAAGDRIGRAAGQRSAEHRDEY